MHEAPHFEDEKSALIDIVSTIGKATSPSQAIAAADTPKPVKITVGRLTRVDENLKQALIHLVRAEDAINEMVAGKETSSSEVVIALRNLRTKLNPAGGVVVESKADLRDLVATVQDLL